MELFIEKSKQKFGNIFEFDKLTYISTKKQVGVKCIKHNNMF